MHLAEFRAAVKRGEHLARIEPMVGVERALHPLLLLDKGSVSRVLLAQALAEAGLLPQMVMEVGSIEVIKRYVEIGLGISIIPRFTAEAEIEVGRLHAIPVDWLPDRFVGVIQRQEGYLSPAAQTFLDMLDEHVTERWTSLGS